MKEQPKKESKSWEELIARLLKLYVKALFKVYDCDSESKEDGEHRLEIRAKIVEIGKTLDEKEKQYKALVEEYGME